MSNLEKAKKLAKQNGLKGFRKIRVARGGYAVGRQTERMTEGTALNVMAGFEKLGFQICQKQTCLELAAKGLLDTLTIRGA